MRAILRNSDLTEVYEKKAVSYGEIELIKSVLESVGFEEKTIDWSGKFSHVVTFSNGELVAYLDIC